MTMTGAQLEVTKGTTSCFGTFLDEVRIFITPFFCHPPMSTLILIRIAVGFGRISFLVNS